MENNNKESFKLLGMSPSGSDSVSDVPEFVLTPPRKKKIKRRLRGTPGSRSRQSQPVCRCKGRTISLSLAAVLLFCWLITITWLAIVLHGELKRLDNNVQTVVAGNQGVPDELQRYHSVTHDLQQNQTKLFSRIDTLSHQLQNFSNQLALMQAGLQNVEERLKAAPELVNLPLDVQSLSTSVASFGSQIRDLNSTVSGLKNDNRQLQELAKTLRDNVTSLTQKMVQMVNVTQQMQYPAKENSAESEAILPVISQLVANVSLVNDTFSKKLLWLQEDQKLDHKIVMSLQDSSQNISARLTTLEGECVKTSLHTSLNDTVDKLAHQVSDGNSRLNEVSRQVSQLQTQAQQLETNTTQLANQLNQIMNSLEPTGITPTQDYPSWSTAQREP